VHLQLAPRTLQRNEYRKVILPLTVLCRFDCLLAPTKEQVLEEFKAIKTKSLSANKNGRSICYLRTSSKSETVVRSLLQKITGRPFYNLSKLDMKKLYKDRKAFLTDLKAVDRERDVHLDISELKAILNALGERDETAGIQRGQDSVR